MKRQLIAIDTEYNSNENLGTINKVFCIAACEPEIVEKGDWFVGDKEYINLFATLWTDDIEEQTKIIAQYDRQQRRNANYVKHYNETKI